MVKNNQNQQIKEKWYNRIWFTKNLCWLYVALVSCWLDIKNFKKFREDISNEMKNPNSLFNKLGLKRNKIGNVIYTHKIIDKDRMETFDERMRTLYLKDSTKMEHDYLFDELLWAEYLITNFIEFSDEKGNLSRCFGVTFTFTPYSINNPKVYKFLIFYLVFFGIIGWLSRHWIWTGLIYIWNLFIS